MERCRKGNILYTTHQLEQEHSSSYPGSCSIHPLPHIPLPWSLMHRALSLILLVLLLPAKSNAQRYSPVEADSLLERLSGNPIADYEATLPVARGLYRHFRQRTDTCRMAEASVAMGSCFDALGQLDSALFILLQASSWTGPACKPILPFRIAINLSSVYISLEEYDKADSMCTMALGWIPEHDSNVLRSDLLFNRAVALANQGDLHGADAQFAALAEEAREQGDANSEIDAILNRGAIAGMQKDHVKAEEHLRTALQRCTELDCPMRAMILRNLASLAGSKGRYREALALGDSALVHAQAHGELELQVDIISNQALSAHSLGEHELTWDLMQQFRTLRDSLLDVEKVRAVSDVREKYQSEKRLRQIKELEVEKLDADLRQSSLKRTRNIYLFIGIVVIGLAGGLWSRLRYVHRSRAAIQHEKDISESLLHNILPEEVAAELKAKGEAEARLIGSVTVLFTDFKGFTALSEVLSPKELVRDLHECFSAFDTIMEKHGLEKIKTIGDAYMAAGGLPVENATHAVDAVRAALEMRDFIAEGQAQKQAEGKPFFEVRIGIHSGPVVAGIVGVKKFQYDIWGDTVNTASRMESSGEAGQVNISEATYELVQGEPGLTFTPRGKVQAKGKGKLEMFFVRRSASSSTIS
jgi:adenylate cyclase